MALTVDVFTIDQRFVAGSTPNTSQFALQASRAISGSNKLIVVVSALSNTAGGGASSFDNFQDDVGNTYTTRIHTNNDPGAAGAGVTLAVGTAPVTNALSSTDSIDVVVSPATQLGAIFFVVSASSGNTVEYVTGNSSTATNTTTPSITSSSITSGDMIVGILAEEYNQIPTRDSDTSNGSWSADTLYDNDYIGDGPASASGMGVAVQYKVVTGTGTQTYNPTLGSAADIAIGWIQLREVTGTTTNNGRGQAQARIKQTYRGYGQAQGQIKTTYNSFAQAQATIKQTYNAFAQAQAQIKQTYLGYGQAQSLIINTRTAFAQARASIRRDDTYRNSVLSDLPIAYFRLGEPSGTTMTDETGNHTGSYVGTPIYGTMGAVTDTDTAITLDGSGSDYGHVTGWGDQPGPPASIEGWIKHDGVTFSFDEMTLAGWTDETGQQFSLMAWPIDSSTIRIGLYTDNGNANYVWTPDTEWHHVVGTAVAGGTGLTLYFDGTQVSTGGFGYTGGASAVPFRIGVGDDAGTIINSWSGSIDEVAVYNSALTLTRIQTHYSFKSPVRTRHAQAQALIVKTNIEGFAQAATYVDTGFYILRDTFTRTESNGWGSPDIGPSWVVASWTAPEDISVTGGQGIVSFNNENGSKALLNPQINLRNLENNFTLLLTALPTTASPFEIYSIYRLSSDLNIYFSYISINLHIKSTGAIDIIFEYFPGSTILASDYTTIQANQTYQFKSRIVDSANLTNTFIYVKIWKVGDPEPEWTSITVPYGAVGGHITLDNNVYNSLDTVDFRYDNYNIYESILAGYGQAQALIAGAVQPNGFAQAQASIKQTYNSFAQAQAQILATYQSYAQAQGQIKQTYNLFAQAQAQIYVPVFLRPEEDITTNNVVGVVI